MSGERPILVSLSDQYGGPDPTFRWCLLQAIAWIASRDIAWVKGLSVALAKRGGYYIGEGPSTAAIAKQTLELELLIWSGEGHQLQSFPVALAELMEVLREGMACYINGEVVTLTSLPIFGLTFRGADVGVSLVGRDEALWITLEAEELRRRFPEHAPTKLPRPRSVGLDLTDGPLLEEMRELIAARKATSPNDAALQVSVKARGASPDASRIRLGQKYRAGLNKVEGLQSSSKT